MKIGDAYVYYVYGKYFGNLCARVCIATCMWDIKSIANGVKKGDWMSNGECLKKLRYRS